MWLRLNSRKRAADVYYRVLARVGILDRKTQKQLNRLNVSLFTPSLLFNKVAFSLSPEKLKELWVIPIFFIGITAVSSLVAFILGVVFRLKRSQRYGVFFVNCIP